MSENALYVAVEVQDESAVIDTSHAQLWNASDGCELYIDVVHSQRDTAVIQYAVRGNVRSRSLDPQRRDQRDLVFEHCDVGVTRRESGHTYEWRVDIKNLVESIPEAHPAPFVGLDLVVCDRDEDGSFSWIAWGPMPRKLTTERVGLAILEDGSTAGTIAGRIEWEDMEEGSRLGRVRIQSLQMDDLWTDITTDGEGLYQAVLLPGPYRMTAGYRSERSSIGEVQVRSAEETRLGRTLVAKPPLGVSRRAGSGRTVDAGSGIRHGAWSTLDGSHGLPSFTIRTIFQDRDRQQHVVRDAHGCVPIRWLPTHCLHRKGWLTR